MPILTNVYSVIGLVLAIIIIVSNKSSLGTKAGMLLILWAVIFMVEQPDLVREWIWKARILMSNE